MTYGSMPQPDRAPHPQPVLFRLHMLLSFPEGDTYPTEDSCTWATEMGVVDLQVSRRPAPAFSTLITGREPA